MLESYNVERSRYLCNVVNTELKIQCSYGYFDLGEYILFPEDEKEKVLNYLRSNYGGITFESVGTSGSNLILLVKHNTREV